VDLKFSALSSGILSRFAFEKESLCAFTCVEGDDPATSQQILPEIQVVVAQTASLQLVTVNEERALATRRSLPNLLSSEHSAYHSSPASTLQWLPARLSATETEVKSPAGIDWPVLSLAAVDRTIYGRDSQGLFMFNWDISEVLRPSCGKATIHDRERQASHGSLVSAVSWSSIRGDAIPVVLSLYESSSFDDSTPDHVIVACNGDEIELFTVSLNGSSTAPTFRQAVLSTIEFDCTGLVIDAKFGCVFLSDAAGSAVYFIDLCKAKPPKSFKVTTHFSPCPLAVPIPLSSVFHALNH
jgi:hypothetical protein